jgi:hypothetical protein
LVENKVFISPSKTIHSSGQCAGAPSRLSGSLGDEVNRPGEAIPFQPSMKFFY